MEVSISPGLAPVDLTSYNYSFEGTFKEEVGFVAGYGMLR
jgi:hypothetical protein